MNNSYQSIFFIIVFLCLFLYFLNFLFFCHTKMIDASEKMGYCYFLMVVRSESMKPFLHVGDILVSYPINLDGYCSKRGNENDFDEILKKGDVVIMEVQNIHIVHRLVDIECVSQKHLKLEHSNLQEEKFHSVDRIEFMTKGDANRNNDFQLLSSSSNLSRHSNQRYTFEKELVSDVSIIRGKIGFVIPKLGLPVTYIRNTYLGKAILGICWMVIIYNYIK